MIDWTAVTEGALALVSAGAMAVAFWVRSTTGTQISTTIVTSCKDGPIASTIDAAITDEIAMACKDGPIATAMDARIERAAAHLYDRINGHDHRLTRLEAAVADLPRARDLHTIALQVSEMLGEMKGVRSELHSQGERFKRHEGQLDRLEQWAIEAAKENAEGKGT